MKLEVRDGNFHYPKQSALLYQNAIGFELNSGEILTILGPNGAGKTTLLKCMMGLERWKHGNTYLDNTPISQLSSKALWQKIAYVPQAHRLVFGFSLLDLVVMGRANQISMFAKPSAHDYQLAQSALEDVGIGHLADLSSHEVSGGELQLAFIARALVSQPELLILDEPESHLDVQKQVVILQTLKRLSKEKLLACVVNTHYPNHAFYLADKVLMIAKGKVPLYGGVNDVMTEENMHLYFNIELKKFYVEQDNLTFETMIPLALASQR